MEKRYAYATFVMRNDRYVPGALVLAYEFRKLGVVYDLICLVTEEVSEEACFLLEILYDRVIPVEETFIEHKQQHQRQDRPFLFTRFHLLRLGEDGDLGCTYHKVLMMDADTMPLKPMDELFELRCPAGIINEHKRHWYDEGDHSCRVQGKSIWHDVYEEVCPHGSQIPAELTDRVWQDPTNMGVNACMWLIEPSMEDYRRIMSVVKCQRVLERISDFNWPEMQFATAYYSGRWHSIDIRYCAYNAHPSLESVYGTHFAGMKPWDLRRKKSLVHYSGHDDYQLWYREFYEMAKWVYPQMQAHKGMGKVVDFCEEEILQYQRL